MPMRSSTPHWLSPDEQQAWLAFIAVVELLPGQLDAQLQRDAGETHFEYMTMAMLSEAENRTLRMTTLAVSTHSTLPRLSHVVTRLVGRGYVERIPCPQDKRATDVRLTETGWEHLEASAPGHVAIVRELVIDPLRPEQIKQLHDIATSILDRLPRTTRSHSVLRQVDGPDVDRSGADQLNGEDGQ